MCKCYAANNYKRDTNIEHYQSNSHEYFVVFFQRGLPVVYGEPLKSSVCNLTLLLSHPPRFGPEIIRSRRWCRVLPSHWLGRCLEKICPRLAFC